MIRAIAWATCWICGRDFAGLTLDCGTIDPQHTRARRGE